MKNRFFPAVIIASLLVFFGFTSKVKDHCDIRMSGSIFIANEILKDFRIPSQGYYPEFVKNLKKNTSVPENKQEEQNIDRGWYSQVMENIRNEEYNISFSDELNAFQSPNRANNFRFVYYNDGFTVSPRTTKIPLFDNSDRLIKEEDKKYKTLNDWEIRFALTEYGREGNYSKFNGDGIQASKNTAYCEDNNMKITYLNDEKGMRQDFIVKSRPDGNSDKLVLKFKVNTRLKTEITQGGIKFSDRSNTVVMQYSSLYVTDANGKVLNAKFRKVNSREYKIIVDEKDAVYPVTVDPLSSTPNWTTESNQADAHYGSSVSTAGDVNGDGYSDVIVGARLFDNGQTDEGKAWIFYGTLSGLSLTANWTAESDLSNAWFGHGVSTAGDVNGDGYSDVIVGANGFRNGEYYEGRTFVYHGSPSGLSATANWTAESNQANAYFGWSVSTAGDVNGDGYSDVIVGAREYDNGQSNEGRTFVYHGSSAGLSATANWTKESDLEGACFGWSVSTAGDVNGDGFSDVIIGTPNYYNGLANEGGVWVYHGSSSGLSTTANWTKESDLEGAYFGWVVSTAGDVNGDGYSDMIVGALAFSNGESIEGGVWVYHGSASGLSLTANWTTEGNQEFANFGNSVSTAGDVNGDGYSDVIVGAYNYDSGQYNEGRAFVYHGSATGLSLTANWTAESDQTNAWFGYSVSTAGDVNGDGFSDVIIGAPQYSNGHSYEGKAFVYHGSSAGLYLYFGWGGESNQTSAYYGRCISTAGDVNGDGFSDVIVSAPNYDNGQTDEGAVWVYYGSASGLSPAGLWSAEGNQASAYFGISVSAAGDVNGDGFGDVIIGAYSYDNGQTDEGRVYVYYGSSSGLSSSPGWTAESNQESSNFGWSVAGLGDVNGDGYGDVIAGAYFYDNGEVNEGAAFVYHGSASGPSLIADKILEYNIAGACFGVSVSSAGDVNGDGFSDAVVGSHYYYNGESGEGAVFVFHGSVSGLSNSPNWIRESNQINTCLGNYVSCAGDVNGDGYSDVIAGAYVYDNVQTDEGAVFVFHGSASGLLYGPAVMIESNQGGAQFGISVSGAGDVNGDGYSDVIVGAPGYDYPESDEGRAFLYYGSSAGLLSTFAWSSEPNQAYAYLGISVASAGDVNGDGYSDVVVGIFHYDNGHTDEGYALLYYGNYGKGLRSSIQQYKPNSSTVIPPLGLSGTNGSVRLSQFSKSPFGRADGKLVWEFKQNGQPFSGPNSVSYSGMQSGYTDISSTGQMLNSDIAGIPTMKEYKWRVRTKFSPVNNPYQVYGPWRYYTSYMPVPWGCFKAQDSPLPVELMSFNHSVDKNTVKLKWTTGKEINNKGFSIERYDNNKKGEWTDIGFIEGKGNTNNPVSYEFTDKNVIRSSYKYRLKQTDYNGNYKYHELQHDVVIGVPKKFELEQNYPNPFNPVTKITFSMPNDSRVTLKVYDISGREVKTLINGELKTANWYTVDFSGAGLSSGVYFCRLTADGINKYTAVKKMMLVK